MKLSERLQQDNVSGDFGQALEGYPEKAEQLEVALESIIKRIDAGNLDGPSLAALKNTAEMGLHNSKL